LLRISQEGKMAQIPIQKPKAFSRPVIASTCKVRGNLIVKGEIASVPSQ